MDFANYFIINKILFRHWKVFCILINTLNITQYINKHFQDIRLSTDLAALKPI